MSSNDFILWQGVMEVELESMYFNEVWGLIEAPKEIKLIGCKWVYNMKRGVDGRVETTKARLVMKGYSQKLGFDYEKTFSPIAMLYQNSPTYCVASQLRDMKNGSQDNILEQWS